MRKQVNLENVESTALSRRFGVSELPDIKVFIDGQVSGYQTGAEMLDLLDVVRWNVWNARCFKGTAVKGLHHSKSSQVVEIVGMPGLEAFLATNQIVLVAFATRWCTRCSVLSAELDIAAVLLAAAEPPVELGLVDVDDPSNWPLLKRFGIYSFPVGKIFHRGRLVSDFIGGSEAHEIATEMLAIRNYVHLAEQEQCMFT